MEYVCWQLHLLSHLMDLSVYIPCFSFLHVCFRYDIMCPSMIDRGEWGRGDDVRLLQALAEGGYEHEWQVRGRGGTDCEFYK